MRVRCIGFLSAIALMTATSFGQTITTVAGGALSGCSKADGVSALMACMQPSGIAFDSQGNLYISDGQYYKVRKVDKNGIVTTVAGSTYGFSGDGGPATSAQLTLQAGAPGLSGLAVDAQGNVYISDTHNCVIRLVTAATGIITTIAGNTAPNATTPSCGSGGDNGPATKASLFYPSGIALDGAGNLYIADNLSNKIRKVDKSNTITTVAGNGSSIFSGDGGPATAAGISSPVGVKFDGAGNMYIAEGNRVRKVDTSGKITTIAGLPGNGTNYGFSGDGGPATAAALFGPLDIVVDQAGDIFIADNQNLRVRKIDPTGVISTYAGVYGPVSTPVGDGGPATSAYLGNPLGLLLDSAGELFIAETQGAVRKVAAPGSFTCTNSAPVTITSVNSASAYGGYLYFASGSWLEIKGTNLADPADPRLTAASNPGQWTAADFNGSAAPTSLDGISVSINGKPAYVWYLSPAQINVQAPEDPTIGTVAITVTNCKATSSPFTSTRRGLAPGLLAPSSFNLGGKQYLVATFNSDGAYVLNTGALGGINSRPAKPGDLIIAYGIGFGDVTPSILPGVIAEQSNSLNNSVTVAFGSTNAALSYAGLAGNFVGLYEFYITVPPGLANGDYQINVTQNGAALPQTMFLTIHN
jgi:uncharacterized protein (TIGR03437 family)